MFESDLHAGTRGEVLERGLSEATSDLIIVNPTRATMREFVDAYQAVPDPPSVSLFADAAPLKQLVEDFLIASALADMVAADAVTVRTLGTVPRHSIMLSEEFLVSLVESGGRICGLTTVEESFVTGTYDEYRTRWADASSFSLRTPPLSHIRETLADDIGQDVADDFDTVLGMLETARGNGDGLDEVTIAILAAANNSQLLYDISHWGEDIRLASKATFSRSKNQLEDAGLIDTGKVPIEVGRPRLRLELGDDELREAGIEKVARRTLQLMD